MKVRARLLPRQIEYTNSTSVWFITKNTWRSSHVSLVDHILECESAVHSKGLLTSRHTLCSRKIHSFSSFPHSTPDPRCRGRRVDNDANNGGWDQERPDWPNCPWRARPATSWIRRRAAVQGVRAPYSATDINADEKSGERERQTCLFRCFKPQEAFRDDYPVSRKSMFTDKLVSVSGHVAASRSLDPHDASNAGSCINNSPQRYCHCNRQRQEQERGERTDNRRSLRHADAERGWERATTTAATITYAREDAAESFLGLGAGIRG